MFFVDMLVNIFQLRARRFAHARITRLIRLWNGEGAWLICTVGERAATLNRAYPIFKNL